MKHKQPVKAIEPTLLEETLHDCRQFPRQTTLS